MKKKVVECIFVVLVTTVVGFSGMVLVSSEEIGEPHVVGIKMVFYDPRPDGLPTAGLSYFVIYSDGTLMTFLESVLFEWKKIQQNIYGAKVYYEGATRVVSFSQSQNNPEVHTFEAMMYPDVVQRLEVEGTSLEIPANAISRFTVITVSPLTDAELPRLDLGMVDVTGQHRGYRFGPHGLKFRAPVTIRVPYDPAISQETAELDVQTYYFDEGINRWLPVEKVGVDAREQVIISRTDHFTDFINSILVLPDHPNPTSFDPNALKNVKLADPSAGISLIEPPSGDSTGGANLAYPLDLPSGRNGMQPELKLTYSNNKRNGWLGLGWDLVTPNIQIDTRFGVPRYDGSSETETYLLNGMELAPVANLLAPEPRQSERAYTLRVEGSFQRIIRHGDAPNTYWWEVTDKSGIRAIYGQTASARLSDYNGSGAIFQWNLEQVIDPDSNTITYTYLKDTGSTGEPFMQIYLKQIDYTGIDGTGAFYHVKFFLDAAGTRLDSFSTGRPGFKVYTRHRLDHIDVLAGTEIIRKYQFVYKTGDFNKSLLEAVVLLGAEGNNELYRHSFEYFEMPKQGNDIDGFGTQIVWDKVGTSQGLTKQEDFTKGGNLFVGVGPLDCDPHIGVGVGYTTGEDTTRSLFLDVNGDGLLDRIKDSGDVDLNFLDADHTLGGYQTGVTFSGVSKGDLGHGQQDAFSAQAAIHFRGGASVSTDYTWSHVNEDQIVSDLNGDGLPDLVSVKGGNFQVHLNDGQSFQPAVSWSGFDLIGLDFTNTDEEADVKTVFHKSDPLLKWVAPFTGTVDIAGTLQRKAAGGDGVIATIFKGNTKLWEQTISATDFGTYVPALLNTTVTAGDCVYFKLNAIDDTDFDAMLWDPRITYVGENIGLQEPYGPRIFDFSEGADFRLAGPPTVKWVADTDGSVSISGTVIKQTTADDVTVRIVKNGSMVLLTQNLAANTTGNFPQNLTINVLAKDKLTFEVLSDSPIDPARVGWEPVVTYTVYTRVDPATGNPVSGAVTCGPDPQTGEMVCTMVNDPIPEAPIDPDSIIQPVQVRYPVFQYLPATPTATFVAPISGKVRIFGTVQKNPVAPAVCVYIQGVHQLHYKNFYEATDVGDVPPVLTHDFTLDVTAGDQIFFSAISTSDQAPTNVTWTPVVQYLTPASGGTFTPTVNFRHIDPAFANEPMSGGFHRWFAGEWNGDEAFDENHIDLPTDPNTPNTYFSPMVPRRQGLEGVPVPLWVGTGFETYIAAAEMKPSRLGTNVGEIISGSGITALRKSLGKNFAVGVGYIGSLSVSDGFSIGQLDFFDINGDHFPDQVAQDSVRFNNGFNGFGGSESISFGFGDLRRIKNSNVSLSFGLGSLVNKIDGEGDTARFAHYLPSIGTYGGVSSAQVDFIDMNGDGLPDHVARDPGGPLVVRLNLGYRFGNEEIWPASSWSRSDIRSTLGLGALTLGDTDTNVLHLSNNVGANIGVAVGPFGAALSYGVTRGVVDYIDLNGDGLPDYVMKLDGENFLRVKLNLGDSFDEERQWLMPGWAVNLGNDITKTLFGGNDTLYFTESITGNASFGFPICIPIPFLGICIVIELSVFVSVGRLGAELRLQDVDGDGTPDQVLKLDGDGNVYTKLNKHGKTNLLKTVIRPLGGKIMLDYHREGNKVDLSNPLQKVDMPTNQWVLSSVTMDDGRGTTYTNTYEYFTSGFYDRQERENYGYFRVRETRPDGSTVDLFFHNQDFYRKGLQFKTVVADAMGNLFEVSTMGYELRPVQPGSFFPALVTQSTFFYEGTTTNESRFQKSMHEEFDYDSFGNVVVFRDFGDEGADDDTFGTIQYHQDMTKYIIKPNLLEVRDSSGHLLRKRLGTFDAQGHMTGLESVLIGGKDPATGAPYTGIINPIWQLSYDGFGNLTKVVDPNGYTLQYVYDQTVHTHIIKIVDSFGYTSEATYDLKYGLVTESKDINGNKVQHTYDEFGRLIEVFGPYDIGSSSTIAMEYYPEASPPYAITHHKDIGGSDPIDTVTFIDGLKREIQTKKDAELDLGSDTSTQIGMTVSGQIVFDVMGRIAQRGQPVFDTGPTASFVAVPIKNPIRFEYDIMGRTIRVINPDNSTTTTDYDFGTLDGVTRFQTTETDPEGKIKHTYRSVRDEILGIEEFNTIGGVFKTLTTRYSYNPLQEIVRVTDANGNITQVEYDTLGRRIVLDNPDTGRTEFRYDLAGNLGAKITANLAVANQQIRYLWTFNRLDRIDYPESVDVTYTYGPAGAPFNRVGRIVTVEDESGLEERFYGKLGETVKTTKSFTSKTPTKKGEVYTTEFAFDSFGRLRRLTYDDGEVITYTYNAGGRLESVGGSLRGISYRYVPHMGYDEFEERVRVVYGNGIETEYNYDPQRRWMNNLQTDTPLGKKLQNLNYTYDLVGNIISLQNDIPVPPPNEMGGPIDQHFHYDDLYQLTSATGMYGFAPGKENRYQLEMTYDEIGNIVRKAQENIIIQPSGKGVLQKKTTYTFDYQYDGFQPHAATHIGDRTFFYDANGNNMGWDHDRNGTRRRVVWDEENRVKSVSDNGRTTRFLYNSDGERTHKVGAQGETIYVNQFYIVRNREIVSKHIFAGKVRVATKIETGMGSKDGKVTICHKGKTIRVAEAAVEPHLAHGDTLGPCDGDGTGKPFNLHLYFYHPDHLGSSNYVSDGDGEPFQHIEYFPTGETWAEERSNIQRTPFLFTAKEWDEETGLYYHGARYYDPQQSQWISPDPLLIKDVDTQEISEVFDPITLASYTYARNRPVNFVDESGLKPTPPDFRRWFALVAEIRGIFFSVRGMMLQFIPLIGDFLSKPFFQIGKGFYTLSDIIMGERTTRPLSIRILSGVILWSGFEDLKKLEPDYGISIEGDRFKGTFSVLVPKLASKLAEEKKIPKWIGWIGTMLRGRRISGNYSISKGKITMTFSEGTSLVSMKYIEEKMRQFLKNPIQELKKMRNASM